MQSTLNVGAGGYNYLPGNALGSLIHSSVYLPPIAPSSVSGATGLGVGGSAVINPAYGVDSHAGSVKLLTGTSGVAATGLVTVNFQTSENKLCLATATAGFAAGSVVTLSGNVSNMAIQFSWTSPGALTDKFVLLFQLPVGIIVAAIGWIMTISPAFAQYQPGTQFFPIGATDTNYTPSFKKYLYSFALPQPAIGVVGIGGYVATVSQTNAFSEALISVHFLPTGNCPTNGSVYDTYEQIGQAFPGIAQIAQFIVKSPVATTAVVPTQILLPAPIAVRGCIVLILDGGNATVGGMLTMISNMSLAYIPGPVPSSTSLVTLDDEFCLVQSCGQLSVAAPSLQTAFAKVAPITQASTLVALYGDVSDSALGPVKFAPPPTGPWMTSNDYYLYPGCGGMSAGLGGPSDYYASIPTNAIHLANVTMQGAGDTAQQQMISQPINQPLAVGDCLVHLFRASTNGAIDAESQVFALTTSP